MKAIILIIIVLFSFSETNAQEVSSTTKTPLHIEKIQTHKVDFYKALIATNNFDVQIKSTVKTTTQTKSDYYNLLLEKNGLTTVSNVTNRLVPTKQEKTIHTANINLVTSLMP